MIEFKIKRHALRDVEVVEVWMDGVFRATITPDDGGDGIRIISRYFLLRPPAHAYLGEGAEAWLLYFRRGQ